MAKSKGIDPTLVVTGIGVALSAAGLGYVVLSSKAQAAPPPPPVQPPPQVVIQPDGTVKKNNTADTIDAVSGALESGAKVFGTLWDTFGGGK